MTLPSNITALRIRLECLVNALDRPLSGEERLEVEKCRVILERILEGSISRETDHMAWTAEIVSEAERRLAEDYELEALGQFV